MEFGGVSVPGRNARTDGAYLLKDLSAFEAQLGGLTAFVMVSDGTGDGPGSDVASQLAVKAADTHLGSVLRSIATGQAPVVEPFAMLRAIVAAANRAVMDEAAEVGGSDVEATFLGAFVSADRVWFGQLGAGAAYVLREDGASRLVAESAAVTAVATPEEPVAAVPTPQPTPGPAAGDFAAADVTQVLERIPAIVQPVPGDETVAAPAVADSAVPAAAPDASATVPAAPAPAPTALGHEGARMEVGSADLGESDVLVLLGAQASEALGDADIRGIACGACDARVAAADLAAVAATAEPERAVTLAVWSADSALFTPVPEPEHEAAPVVLFANSDTTASFRAERIFLWVMAGLIVAEVLALGVMAFLSKPSLAEKTASTAATVEAETSVEPTPVPEPAVVATVTQEPTATVPPVEAEQPEFPKKLTVPENVPGGLWLRKKATTAGGSNLVIQLKRGAKLEAIGSKEVEGANGEMQLFYEFNVADIDSDDVLETGSYEWPPSKSITSVYGFAASFEE